MGLKPERQYPISKHRVDFAFPKEKLVIEVDGPHYRTREEIQRDEKRRDVAENLGWRVKRFTAEETFDNTEEVARRIVRMVRTKEISKELFNDAEANIDRSLKLKINKKNRVSRIKPLQSEMADFRKELERLKEEQQKPNWKSDYEIMGPQINSVPIASPKTWTSKVALIIVILGVIALTIFSIQNNNNKEIPTKSTETPLIVISNPIPEPTKSLLVVEGSSADVIITNNKEESVSVNVEYRIYSRWFGADYVNSQIFQVASQSKKSFRVYDNVGCSSAPCSVEIISYKEE